mgnify:CR=1 FL=1
MTFKVHIAGTPAGVKRAFADKFVETSKTMPAFAALIQYVAAEMDRLEAAGLKGVSLRVMLLHGPNEVVSEVSVKETEIA